MKFALTIVALVVAGLSLSWQGVDRPSKEDPTVRRTSTPNMLALDGSGNGYHGVNQGAPVTGLRGHRGTAYSFDYPGSWIQVPSEPALNPYNKDFLFSAWVNFTENPEGRQTADILRKGVSFSVGGVYKLELIAGGRVRCSAKGARSVKSYRVLGPEISLAENQWHYIACARAGSTWSVIVDDTVSSETANLGSIRNTMPLSIGSKYGLEDVPKGKVDEATLIIDDSSTDPARPPADVLAAIQRLRDRPPTAIWRLDETEAMGGPRL